MTSSATSRLPWTVWLFLAQHALNLASLLPFTPGWISSRPVLGWASLVYCAATLVFFHGVRQRSSWSWSLGVALNFAPFLALPGLAPLRVELLMRLQSEIESKGIALDPAALESIVNLAWNVCVGALVLQSVLAILVFYRNRGVLSGSARD